MTDHGELRDQLAMAALTGILSNRVSLDHALHSGMTHAQFSAHAAHTSYEYADAMIEERKRLQGNETFSDPNFPFMPDNAVMGAEAVKKSIIVNVGRERERCAKIAEESMGGDGPWGLRTLEEVAAKIRSSE